MHGALLALLTILLQSWGNWWESSRNWWKHCPFHNASKISILSKMNHYLLFPRNHALLLYSLRFWVRSLHQVSMLTGTTVRMTGLLMACCIKVILYLVMHLLKTLKIRTARSLQTPIIIIVRYIFSEVVEVCCISVFVHWRVSFWSNLVHKPGDFDDDLSFLLAFFLLVEWAAINPCTGIAPRDVLKSAIWIGREVCADIQDFQTISLWMTLSPDFSSNITASFSFVVLSEIFLQLLDGLQLNVVTYVPLWLKCNNFSDPFTFPSCVIIRLVS